MTDFVSVRLEALRDPDVPVYVRDKLVEQLLNTPSFDVEAAIAQLKVEWWGDDPIGCRLAWETLENGYV